MGYKLRLATTASLSGNIQESANTIAKSRSRIKQLNEKLKPSFASLKKARTELTKLSSQKARLKEEHPRLKNMYAKKQQAVKDISASIMYNIVNILKEIDSIVFDMKSVIFDADTILYRESKTLDKFHKEVGKIKDKKLSAEIAGQLNVLKEEMKTAARRLYESVEAAGILKKPFSRKKKLALSQGISQLSTEAVQLEKVLEKLKITNIEEITKNAEKELNDIRRIEIAIVSLVPELKRHLSRIRNDLYLLESSAAERIKEKLSSSERKLDKTLAKISSQAEQLFEEIVIIEKIK